MGWPGTPHLCQSRHNSTRHGWGGGLSVYAVMTDGVEPTRSWRGGVCILAELPGVFGVRSAGPAVVATAALEPTLLHSLLCHGLRSPKPDPSFILPPCYDQPWSMDRYFHNYHNQCPDTFSQRLQVLGWPNIKQLKSQFFLCT